MLGRAKKLVSSQRVEAAYDDLAGQLQPLVDAGDCLLLGVMMGGMIPLAQIASRLRGDFLMDYCHATRYRGGTRGGVPQWVQRPRLGLAGRTVVLVDDIYDEGHTLAFIAAYCRAENAARVFSAVLVRKIHPRTVAAMMPDFVGLNVEDRYVFGCGMDYRERWRHLGEIYALPAGEAAGHDD